MLMNFSPRATWGSELLSAPFACIACVAEIVVSGTEACFTVIITTVINIYKLFIQGIRNDLQFLVYLFISSESLADRPSRSLGQRVRLKCFELKPLTLSPRKHLRPTRGIILLKFVLLDPTSGFLIPWEVF